MKNIENKFSEVYKNNLWKGKESVSGTGSDKENTLILRTKLIELLNSLNIKILIDGACGDMNWMQYILAYIPTLKKFIGMDIVPEIIKSNTEKHEYENKVIFQCKDIINSYLPKGDLLLCRDCLVHLSFENILQFLNNFKKSKITYLLTTTFINEGRINTDVIVNKGTWRPLNLQKPPFNLPTPDFILNEECTEGNNLFTDKSLGLWKRENLI